MTPLAVTVGDLVELVWVSAFVTLFIVTCFAVAIRATVRAGELRREGRGAAAMTRGAVAGLCYVVVGAAMVAGVAVIAFG